MEIPVTEQVIEYVARHGGRCRDCADNFGLCPNNNLPCDPQKSHDAIKRIVEALNYGFREGFLPTPRRLR